MGCFSLHMCLLCVYISLCGVSCWVVCMSICAHCQNLVLARPVLCLPTGTKFHCVHAAVSECSSCDVWVLECKMHIELCDSLCRASFQDPWSPSPVKTMPSPAAQVLLGLICSPLTCAMQSTKHHAHINSSGEP